MSDDYKTYVPKVFVGTMHVDEGDFETCKDAIHKQVGCAIEHLVISGLNELDAHNELWNAWNLKRVHSKFDMFVKVDADTVLSSDTVVIDAWNLLQSTPGATGIQAPLHDYMSNKFINGLNIFSKNVHFKPVKDRLFCDRVDIANVNILRGNMLPKTLAPAGYHCHHSTHKQAFHYGLHRMLKRQYSIIANVRAAWDKEQDEIRAWALLGANSAKRYITASGFDYSDEEFEREFKKTSENFDSLVRKVLQDR